ncbi:formate dehydrogenase subunit alpha [Terasakiella pusilla]|uniref:formate dehydrogenase subunit alpha n=1 Tax=Terasakiella pusilla TaxID=64973 RepID=UPI000490AAD4|nr:formate dehydrogenase subunit alpha [Terasakiella pusilla]
MLKEIDYGTPKVHSKQLVTLSIDGRSVSVEQGTSVMRAAKLAGISIPKLCATDKLDAFGSCRLCLVKIEGRRGTPASCSTPAEDGMIIQTQNDHLAKLRKGVMELYISDHPLDCLTCSANGNCELQDAAGEVGLREVRYNPQGKNHLDNQKDESNPYFTYDPSKCIVCSRCVRTCEDVQGTFALTIEGRGFDSRISVGHNTNFFDSDCVSCGACVEACPTATLMEKSVIEKGQAEHVVETTCAYCGVGCSLRAEMRGEEVVRMVPSKTGGANEGHACVKGRFAWGYATHQDRITKPMIRDHIEAPWKEVSWEEAIAFSATKLKAIQAKYGPKSIGGITSSRCTNEEVFLVQKMIRAAFGNNNVDTCARVCHSPTGYGLKETYGTSAGTQDFKSVEQADVVLVIGANPTDGHPVFGSRLKKRLREGAKLIVMDPRRIDLVKTPHVEAAYHLPLTPGTNVALLNAFSYTIVKEGLYDDAFIQERCDLDMFQKWKDAIVHPQNDPQIVAKVCGVEPQDIIEAARLYATSHNGAIYYGLGVTEHTQGSTTVMAMANLAMLCGNIGRDGVGVNPLRGQNNVQGSCDMGSFPHEYSGYRHVSDEPTRLLFEDAWKRPLSPEPGLRIPHMFDGAINGQYRGMFVQGEDIAHSDPNTNHVHKALHNLDLLIVQDLFLNETASFAHVFLPGTSFLEKDGTFTNAERRINRVRPVMTSKTGKQEWEIVCELAQALGYDMSYNNASEIMAEIAALTPTFSGVSFEKLDQVGSLQWPCFDQADLGTPVMHETGFTHGKGRFIPTEYIPTPERTSRKYPLLLTTGRILTQYNVGAQTRRTENHKWHSEDLLEIHPHDADERNIQDGDMISIQSRAGTTSLRAKVSHRMQPGTVYTTFHHAVSGTNIVTTNNSDWATNCPEYKVTAVQVEPTHRLHNWERMHAPIEERPLDE